MIWLIQENISTASETLTGQATEAFRKIQLFFKQNIFRKFFCLDLKHEGMGEDNHFEQF